MKLLLTGVVAAALAQSASAASCAISTLSNLLADQYIDQCSSDSGYVFTTGIKPVPAEVAGMCASDACHSLLDDVVAMNLTDCTLPIGDKIYLFADLVDYVSDQCEDEETPAPTTVTPEPTTASPTPAPTTATPAPTTAIASCTSAQLKYLLTSTYEKQCITDTGYVFTSPYSPTDTQVTAMCASESCVNLFAYVASMVTTDCRIPVGGKILLLADLVYYVSDQCSTSTPAPSTTPASTTAAPATPTATTATPVAACATKTITALLTDAYIDQCASDSGYAFTSGVQPDAEEVAGMCASSACASLLADVEAMGLSECSLPIGNKIYLFRDLVDYVSDQCSGSTTTTAPSTTAPATAAPTTTPASTTAAPATPTATTATPVAACATKTITALLTDAYIDQCASDSGYAFTSGVQPDAEEVAGMCASSACASLLADVEAMGLSECSLPIGNKIYLFRDLVDYVSDQCSGSTTTTAPSATAPATAAPTTTPASTTAAPATPTATTATPVAACATKTITALLTDAYIDQCASDSGYAFTSGVQPDAEEVAGMCASSACASLLADVEAMGLSECSLPIGNKIYLFRDLVDYVSDQCSGSTTTTAPSTTAPATAAPTTTPASTTAAPATPTATTATPVAACATKTITALLTDAYIDQCASDSGYAFTSGVQPDAEEVAGMCASSACASLLADVEAMGLSECSLPIGNKIYLFRDLVDYVSDQCSGSTTTSAPSATAPATAAPTTTPASTTAAPATPTATTATPVAACATKTITALLTDAYIDQCASDSGYAFTSGVQPDAEEVAGMCASSACASLLADVEAMGLSECSLPIGNKIYLFRDLVDYVSDQCSGSTTTSAPSATAPATAAPTTTPASTTAAPATPTATTATPVAACATKTITALLTDAYIDQCASDSGYAFTSGVQPDAEEVAGMCASSACASLLADVEAMGLSECSLPIGNKIYLFRDLVDYVSDQCSGSTTTSAPSATAPATAAPTTTPASTTAAPATPTATTATPVAACATKTITALLTDAYIDQCASDSGYAFTSGVQPDAEEVAGMCASSACASLLADVEAMGLSECSLPIGNKIYLFRDLVDYVSDQCSGSTTTSAPSATAPATAAPTTTPASTTAAPATPTATTATPVAACATKTITALLTDAYIDQCASDSGYAFTSGVQPDAEEVAGMCASSACASLLADVEAMGLSECSLPIGNKIYLFRDLVDYVSDQCSGSTTTSAPSATAPATAAPTTTPASTTAAPATPTATTATPVAACATKTITALLTDAYIDQCASDSGYAFTSGVQPDAEEVAGMCASSACASLLADVEAMGLSECSLPIGNKIYLFRDLVDYVSDQCSGSTTTSAPSTTAPATAAPTTTPASTTAAPAMETSAPATGTPTTSMAGSGSATDESPSSDASSTNSSSAAFSTTGSPATSLSGSESSAVSPSTGTPGTESPSTSPPSTPTPSTNSSTADDTPEPTAPTHESC